MERIQRPDNVTVPRSINRKIEARRALESDNVETMRATLKDLGEPHGGNKNELGGRLYQIVQGGNSLSVQPEPAKAASRVAAPSTPKGGE